MTDDIYTVIEVFEHTLHELGADVPPGDVQRLAELIYQAMMAEGRYYHCIEHALALCDPEFPIQTLAALFHDVVYFRIDDGFSDEVWMALQAYLSPSTRGNQSYQIIGSIPVSDRNFHWVMEVFGWPADQDVPLNTGTNEFLSSLIMVNSLSGILCETTLLKIIAYIEATIPFRGTDENGLGPFEHLGLRIKAVCENFDVPMTWEEITETVHGAVRFANRDVENFAGYDVAGFLETTWKLLPETYPALRKGSEYTFNQYRLALQGMLKFLQSIQPEHVYHSFQGVPDQQELNSKLQRTRRNLELSRRYIELKVLTLAILEALAVFSGGDSPVALFLGDISSENHAEPELASYLPKVERTNHGNEADSLFYQLLLSGRKGLVDFSDLKTSPLALVIYQRSEPHTIAHYLETAYQWFDNQLQPREFLQSLEPMLLSIITQACEKMAPSRAETLKVFSMEITQ